MSSVTEAAATQPPALWRRVVNKQNPFMIRLLRSRFHGAVSGAYLLLTLRGRKTGRQYSTPVQYKQEGETIYILTSEGYTWWKNLRGGAEVEVLLRGKTCRAQAITSTDPETVASVMGKIYPMLNSTRRVDSTAGKVALTLTLESTTQRKASAT